MHRSSLFFRFTLLSLTTLLIPTLTAAEKTWYEIRSQHFTVLYDGNEGNVRRITTRLEQFRAAFQRAVPGLSLDGDLPITVIATWDEETYRRLCLPDEAKPSANMGAWRSLAARDRSYVLVWMNPRRHADVHDWGDPNDFMMFEAYTNLIGSTRLRWLPFWLRIGLTRFAAGATVTETKVNLGRELPGYVRTLHPNVMIPLKDVLTVNLSNIEDVKPQSRFFLYAESWGLVHYLLLAANGSHAAELTSYVQSLRGSQTSEQEAAEAFGDLKALERNVGQYFGQRAFPYLIYEVPASAIEPKLQARKLDSKEADVAEADVMLRFGNRKGARELLQNVLRQEPNSAAAKEALGLCALGDANFDEAAGYFTAALAIDASLIEARFYLAMIANREHLKGKPNPLTESELRKVVSESPNFSPAQLELARLLAEQHGPSEEAISLARAAAAKEPYQPGYHLSYGYLQLQAGHVQEGEQAARYVMRIAPEGQELEEARTLLEKSSSSVRSAAARSGDASSAAKAAPDPEAAAPKVENGKATIRGVVESISCLGTARSIMINSDGAKITFDFANLIVLDLPRTMWIPPELFPICKHLTGRTIEVKFKPPVSSVGPTEALAITLPENYP